MQITLNPNVRIKSLDNLIYLSNEALVIEIELETKQFVSALVNAFKTNNFIDKLSKLLGAQEATELLKRLEEAQMTISEEITEYSDFLILEKKCEQEVIATSLKPGDSLTSIYDLLSASTYKDLFYQQFSIAVNAYEKPIWKSRNPQLNTSAIQDFGFSTALIPIKDHHGKEKLIYGFGTSSKGMKEATALAMLECLERIYTMYRVPGAILKNVTFSDLGEEAADPMEFNVFTKEQYNKAGFEFQPFLPHSKLDWVKAESLTKNKSVLLPRPLLTSDGLDKNYAPVSSNGCAIHTCEKRALLSGIEETIERDSMMKAWYQMNSLPVLSDGPELLAKNNIGKILTGLGFEITLLDGTSDLNIPVITGIFEDGHNPYLFTVNTATADTADLAIDKLCNEFFSLWRDYILDENFVFPNNTSGSLKSLSDHFEFYQGEKHIQKRGFLKSGKKSKKSGDMNWGKFNCSEQKINYLAGEFSKKELDILYVNCTSALQKKIGLSSVKVIMPGTIPLFVGKEIPLGIKRLASGKKLNKLPHPYC